MAVNWGETVCDGVCIWLYIWWHVGCGPALKAYVHMHLWWQFLLHLLPAGVGCHLRTAHTGPSLLQPFWLHWWVPLDSTSQYIHLLYVRRCTLHCTYCATVCRDIAFVSIHTVHTMHIRTYLRTHNIYVRSYVLHTYVRTYILCMYYAFFCVSFYYFVIVHSTLHTNVGIVLWSISVTVQATLVVLVMAMVSVFCHKTEDAAADADQELATQRRELTGWAVHMSIPLQWYLLVLVVSIYNKNSELMFENVQCCACACLDILCTYLYATSIIPNVQLYYSTVL